MTWWRAGGWKGLLTAKATSTSPLPEMGQEARRAYPMIGRDGRIEWRVGMRPHVRPIPARARLVRQHRHVSAGKINALGKPEHWGNRRTVGGNTAFIILSMTSACRW